MRWIGLIVGIVLIATVLVESFVAIILPRRVKYSYLVRLFDRYSWYGWRRAARRFASGRRRHTFLSVFGPLMLLVTLALWALGLVVAFGLVHWSAGTALSGTDCGFFDYLYFSGTTFFTLGYGDMVAIGVAGRALSVVEAGLGFGFLAAVLSYLPILYQAFSRREITISLLDARAGSPPTAGELLRRLAAGRGVASTGPLLVEWERWAAELLESHLSYPILSFYRSQHDNQSWVAALTVILDTSALLIVAVDDSDRYQAQLTFAMARHAAVDLALVFETPPLPPQPDRLPEADLMRLRESLRDAGLPMRDGPAVTKKLTELRGLFEPFVNALAAHFELTLPPFQPDRPPVDNWQKSAWMRRSPSLGDLSSADSDDEHFD